MPFSRASANSRKLFIQLVEHLAGIFPIEAHGRGFGTDLLRFHQRREVARHRIQAAELGLAFVFLFVRFDFVPAALHVVGSFRRAVAENVRMPADQLLRDGVERIVDAKLAFFGRHLREEDGLQHQIAELFGQARPIALIDGVQDFVGFFEQIGLDGVESFVRDPKGSRRERAAAP